MSQPLRLAVLLSGSGRTLANLHKHIADGQLNAQIDVVISSRSDVYGVQRAKDLGLQTIIVERKPLSAEDFHDRITAAIGHVDLVCMAGFLSLWHVPENYAGRVLNIHPALLPDFGGRGMYGLRVHQAVIDAGKKESGCTVHICDNEYDHGPVLLQKRVPVLSSDTAEDLADRVFEQECAAYPEAIQFFCAGRVRFEGGRAIVD